MSSISQLSDTLYRAARFSNEWDVLFMASRALSHAEGAPERTDRIESLRRAERGVELAIHRENPEQQITLARAKTTPQSRQLADRIRGYERECRRLQQAVVVERKIVEQ